MTLRYTLSPNNYMKPFTVTKHVADESEARKLMKETIKSKGDTVSNFKLYDPIENRFIEI